MLTTEVENYPGFPTGILGPELMGKMREQAERFGAEFIRADATKVDLAGPPFKAWVEDQEYTGKALIIATGAKAKMLGLPGERQYLGRGVSTCATCDGFFYRNRAGGGRRRRLRARGGHVPVPVRQQGDPDPPSGRAARVGDHAGPRVRGPEDRVRLELRGRDHPRR
jgi:hypothetical protein